MTQALEDRSKLGTSNEDIVTQRKLRFLMYMVELAAKDPEWNGQLSDLVEHFKETENQ